jgi:hypothetical protein
MNLLRALVDPDVLMSRVVGAWVTPNAREPTHSMYGRSEPAVGYA